MHTDTVNTKNLRIHSHGLAVAALCFVLFVASAVAGRLELFSADTGWLKANWFALLIPMVVLACFVFAWGAIRNSDVKLLDAIDLKTMITLTRDGLYCHSMELMIPWSLVESAYVERKMQRSYEVLADLHLCLKEPVLGKTVYTFDVARLCVSSQRALELVTHRVRVNSGNRLGAGSQNSENEKEPASV